MNSMKHGNLRTRATLTGALLALSLAGAAQALAQCGANPCAAKKSGAMQEQHDNPCAEKNPCATKSPCATKNLFTIFLVTAPEKPNG